MIEVTPVAAEKLAALLASAGERRLLRIFVAGRSCCGFQYGLALDERAAPDDTVVERRGIDVAVDPDSLPFVGGATVDYVERDGASGFTVRDPSVGSGCACGR